MKFEFFVNPVSCYFFSSIWVFYEILKHPEVEKNLRHEISSISEASDTHSFDYLDAVIKETLRLHPIAPLCVSV